MVSGVRSSCEALAMNRRWPSNDWSTVRIDGHDVAALSDRQLSALRARRIGFVFQQFHLTNGQSAVDNVADGLLYAGAKVYRSDRIPAAETGGMSVQAAHLDLPQTVGATVADGVWLNAATARYPAVVLGATAAERLEAVALLVGGVGVANTMVIPVLERRAEIGLRRSLGATQSWPTVVPAWATGGGVAATLLIGVVAGLYPAIRAARLAPTEALATP
jgi:hypothetical protein